MKSISFSQNLIIRVLIIAALIVAMVLSSHGRNPQGIAQLPRMLPIKRASTIQSIGFSVDTIGDYRLVRDDAQWVLERNNDVLPVEQARVDSFLSSLLALQGRRLVESEPKDLSAYGLDDRTAQTIIIEQIDSDPMAVSFGSRTSTSEVYVMASNFPNVYTTEASIQNFLSQSSSYWLDLDISIEGEPVLITAEGSWSGRFNSVANSEGQMLWTDSNGRSDDHDFIQGLIDRLKSLRAQDVYQPQESSQQLIIQGNDNAHRLELQIEDSTGNLFELSVYAIPDGEGGEWLFLAVPKWKDFRGQEFFYQLRKFDGEAFFPEYAN